MDGFFLINKPSGITSFQVLREMRRILGVKKIGHSGTLDPLATGCLLVATENYTKLIPYFEKSKKSYRAHIALDGVSPSYDSDTEISYISESLQSSFRTELTHEYISALIEQHFLGVIEQIPPKYSALKIDGKRALDRVLAGEEIEMKSRKSEIFSFEIESFDYPILIAHIQVSAGTYIRSLAHDLGALLGTGGYLTALQRTAVGECDISKATSLEDLKVEKILSLKTLFGAKMYEFSDEEVYIRLSNGQRVAGDFPFPEGEDVFLCYDEKVRYIVEYKKGVLHPRKKVV